MTALLASNISRTIQGVESFDPIFAWHCWLSCAVCCFVPLGSGRRLCSQSSSSIGMNVTGLGSIVRGMAISICLLEGFESERHGAVA